MAQAVSSTEVEHPLAALTGGEIAAAVALVQAHPTFTEATRFAYIGLLEPTKDQVRAWSPGQPVDRRVRLMLVSGPEADVVEAVASLRTGELSMTDVHGVRPGLLFEESFAAIVAVQENAQWQEAMRTTRHRGPRHGADRPVAGGLLRRVARRGTPHLPLPVLRPPHARRQRVRPPHRRSRRLRRHGPRRSARGHRHRGRAHTPRVWQLLPRVRSRCART